RRDPVLSAIPARAHPAPRPRPWAGAAALLLALAPLAGLAAQSAPTPPQTFYACYVPYVGTVYRIKQPGLPDHCFGPTSGPLMHIQFSWTDGQGALHAGDAAGGDLTGTYPNPGVGKLLGVALGSTAPTNGQVLSYNGTSWVATTPPAGVTAHSQLTGLLNDDHPQYLLTNGTRALTGPLSMGGFRLTGLGAATTAGDAVPFQQAVKSGDAAGGDLAGTYPAPTVGKLAGVPLSTTAPASGQVLVFNGTGWAPGAPPAGSPPNIACNGCSATGQDATATGNGTSARGDFSTALGSGSIAIGKGAVAAGISANTGGDRAVAIGYNSTAMSTGAVAIGSGNLATGINSLALGTNNQASGTASTVMGSAASTNGHDGAFVYGDVSTGIVIGAIANNEFAVRASGGFRFRTASDLSTGCDLPAGSGVFSCTSSRDLKTDFIPVDDDALLRGIAAVPVTTWHYRTEAQPVRHLGPMAQDFRAAFGLGTNETSIGLLDISGVTFAGVQALEKRTAELRSAIDELQELRTEVATLRGRAAAAEATNAELARRLGALEAALHASQSAQTKGVER
ncbi:MAG TPA: tail fiber domain-containing protein, partial [Longimicrobiales bacterium]